MIEFDYSYGEARLSNLWDHMTSRRYQAHLLDKRGKLIEIQEIPNIKTYIDLVFTPTLVTSQ